MLPLEVNCLMCSAPLSDVSQLPDGRTIVQLYCGQCFGKSSDGLMELEMGAPIQAAGCQALVRVLSDPDSRHFRALLTLGGHYQRYVDEMSSSKAWWNAYQEALSEGREPPKFVGGRCPNPPSCSFDIAPPTQFAEDRIGIFFTCAKHVNQSFLFHAGKLFLQTVYPLNCDERDTLFFQHLKSLKPIAARVGIAAIPERTVDSLKLVLAWAKAEGLVQEQL